MSAQSNGNTSGPSLVVAPLWEANLDAREAWDAVAAALESADHNLRDELAWFSVGAPGSAEKLREAVELIERAAVLIKAVGEDPAEERRWQLSRPYDDFR
jgi:hypothetical protein